MHLCGMQSDMSLGERIRKAREQLGWSGNALAERSGIAQPSLNRIERDISEAPNVFVVAKIAKALGVTVDDLLGEIEIEPRITTKAARVEDEIADLKQRVADLETRLTDSIAEPKRKRVS